MGSLTIWHWMVVLAVVALLFGRGRISSVMEEIGAGISRFRRGMRDEPDKDSLPPPPAGAGEVQAQHDKVES